jgi:hypothetical protein
MKFEIGDVIRLHEVPSTLSIHLYELLHEVWRAQRKAGLASHGGISTMPSLIADLRQVRAEKGVIAYKSAPRVRSSMRDHWDLRLLAPVSHAIAVSSPLVATPLVLISSTLLGAPVVSALAPAATAERQQWRRHAGEDGLDLPGERVNTNLCGFIAKTNLCGCARDYVEGGIGWGKGMKTNWRIDIFSSFLFLMTWIAAYNHGRNKPPSHQSKPTCVWRRTKLRPIPPAAT